MAPVPAPAPLTPEAAAALWAAWFGAGLPGPARAGVAEALAVLARHRAVVAAALASA